MERLYTLPNGKGSWLASVAGIVNRGYVVSRHHETCALSTKGVNTRGAVPLG